MLSSLTLDDVTGSPVTLHETATRALVQVDGLVGLAPVRRNVRTRPTAHGSIDDSLYLDEDLVSLVGEVWGAGGSQALAYSELGRITSPMLQSLSAAALLKWFPGELTSLTNLVTNPRPISAGGGWVTGVFNTAPATLTYAADGTSPTGQSLQLAGTGATTFQGAEIPLGTLYPGQRYGILAALKTVSGATTGFDVGVFATPSPAGAVVVGAVTGITLTGAYVVSSAIFTATGTVPSPCNLYIRHNTASAATFLFGGAMVIPLGPSQALPAYFDGSAAGFGWTGTADASPSVMLGGRQRLVKLAGPVQPTLQEAAAILRYQASFAAADPFAYEQALTTVTGATITGGGAAAFINAGNAETRPLVRINAVGATLTNPVVTLSGAKKITLVGTIIAGDFIELDLNARTATLNHAGALSNAGSLVDSANTQWFSLPGSATTTLTLTGTGANSSFLTVLGRSAYTV